MEVKDLLFVAFCGVVWSSTASVVCGAAGKDDSSPGPVLGADSFAERQVAGLDLWQKGKESVNLLSALVLSDDPEQAWRARQILRWVDMEMTPDTPQKIIDLVESYLIAPNAKERERIYGELLEAEAYVQLFRLPKHVSDEVVARSLAERVAELAGQVAEEKILAGEDLEALAVLEDAKNAKAGHLRWVALASALGMREELWADLSSEDRMRFARWEGDIEGIKALASPDHEIQVTLRLLDGDPYPFLEKRAKRKDQSGFRTRMALAFWRGEEEGEETIKLRDSLLSTLDENGIEKSRDVVALLAQLGYVQEVLPYFEKESPIDMFEYYQTTERLEAAFRVLGLDVEETIPDSWIEEGIELIEDEFDLANRGCRRLVSMGLFLVERGELEEADRIFEAMYAKMDQLGVNEVSNFLAVLSGRQGNLGLEGYPEFAIGKAMARTEEVFSPESFLSEAFFAEESVFLLYLFLEEREGEVTDWERVRQVFAFFGRKVAVPSDELSAIQAELVKSADENGSEGQWNVLMQSGILRGDIALVEKSIRAMEELLEDKQVIRANLASLLFSDGRHEDANKVLQSLLEEDPSRFDWIEYLAVSLQLSNQPKEAEERLLLVEKLALGDGSWLTSLGNIWGELGNWKKQHELHQQALLLLPSETEAWIQQLYRLAESGRMAGEWQQSAACREAYNSYRTLELYATPLRYFRERGQVDMARAMAAFEKGETERRDQILDRMVSYCGHDSFFADDVLPTLRRAGLHEQAERMWAALSPAYRHSMKTFPQGHNAHNTAAWVASRAACDLDEALQWVEKALEGKPNSSAYLDTHAEVLFAQGQREEALEWSEKACQRSEGIATLGMLRTQYRHFRDDPFPLLSASEQEKD